MKIVIDIRLVIVCLLFHFGSGWSKMVDICNSITNRRCSFSVDNHSVSVMMSDKLSSKSLLVKTELHFERGINSTATTILPNHWIMTRADKRNIHRNLFISWPVDYSIVSFGFLDSRTLKNVKLNIFVSPPDCDVIIGEPDTDCGIVSALVNASKRYVSATKSANKNAHPMSVAFHKNFWCYISEYPEIRNEAWIKLTMYIPLPGRAFGYRCCHTNRDKIVCAYYYSTKWNDYQTIPFYAGIIFFFFFPILLMKCSSTAMDSGKKVTKKMEQYEDLDFDNEKWIFLQKRPPITLAGIALGLFSLGKTHPVATSRIRRVMFVLCTPIIIYIEIYMYYSSWPKLINAVINVKIPFGFASIAGGIYDSKANFLPILGGPCVALILYFVVGVSVVVIPRDFGEALESGIAPSTQASRTLLQLNVITIEELSYKSCMKRRGYHKVHSVLKARVFMVLNPKFWRFAIHFIIKRWKVSWYPICKKVSTCKCFRWMTFILFISLYVILSGTEVLMSVIYHAFPIFHMLYGTGKGYQTYIKRQMLGRNVMLKIGLTFFCPFLLVLYLFLSSLIFFESFNFLSKVIYFLYLSVVVFPNHSFSCIYSMLMLLFFIHRICSEIESDYSDILYETIEAVNHIKTTNSNKEDITESIMEIRREMYVIGASSTYIRDFSAENRHLPGIRRELFNYIVRKYRPVHIAVSMAIVQICVMTLLVISSNYFVSGYVNPMKTVNTTELVHVMSILLITVLPNLVYSLFTPKVNHKVRKLKLRQTVVEYFQIEL